jgi:hypothetical protein
VELVQNISASLKRKHLQFTTTYITLQQEMGLALHLTEVEITTDFLNLDFADFFADFTPSYK